MKKYLGELSFAMVKVFKEVIEFIKYCSKDLESEGKTWKDYFH
ncbi:hypothetical protein [Enterococcus sp. AZ163]